MKEREKEEKSGPSAKIPATIITRYFGARKIILLNDILKEQHGERGIVISNKFEKGSTVEKSLAVSQSALPRKVGTLNCCLCCSVKDNGLGVNENLMQRRENLMIYH